MKHAFHRLFFTERLVAARCDRCYKLVAVYEKDTACLECQTTGGVWRSEGRCGCGIHNWRREVSSRSCSHAHVVPGQALGGGHRSPCE